MFSHPNRRIWLRRLEPCALGDWWLLALVMLFGIWQAKLGRADDHTFSGDTTEFPTVAMELRRLPPVDGSPRETSDDAIDSAVQFNVIPASLENSYNDSAYNAAVEPGIGLYLGYDRGFVIAANQAQGDGPNSLDYLMRVNSWMHMRQTVFDSEGPNPDQNTFSFERLRLSFGGHACSPSLKYFFQLDANSDSSSDTIFLDYVATYDVGYEVLGWEKNRLRIRGGKWKVPFSRSRRETGRMLQFTDRATADVFFDLNRSLGVGLNCQLGSKDPSGWINGPLQLDAALFNGFRTGTLSTERSNGQLDRNFGWSLRSHIDLFSDFGRDGEPDLSWHCLPSMRIGAGLAQTTDDIEGSNEFSRQSVVDSGKTLASILPVDVTAYDVWLSTVDAHLKYHGFSLIAEYYWRSISQLQGGFVPDLSDDGFVLQGGYFVVPHKLELLVRWSRIRGDSGTLGVLNQSSDEIGAGFVWYIKGQNAKFTFDATHLNGAPLSSARLDILPGDVGWLYRSQFQLAF